MTRTFTAWMMALASALGVGGTAWGDVIVRGPFGGQITVWSPTDVRVAPAGVVVVPTAPPPVVVPTPPQGLPQPVPLPPPVVVAPVPQPAAKTPITPQDFARTFQPTAGSHEVVFIHPRTRLAVMVVFDLPAGTPRVSYNANSLVFDYGRHEVEIRFAIGGRVRVVQH
jgi:hypothetical protein